MYPSPTSELRPHSQVAKNSFRTSVHYPLGWMSHDRRAISRWLARGRWIRVWAAAPHPVAAVRRSLRRSTANPSQPPARDARAVRSSASYRGRPHFFEAVSDEPLAVSQNGARTVVCSLWTLVIGVRPSGFAGANLIIGDSIALNPEPRTPDDPSPAVPYEHWTSSSSH